MPQVIEAPSRTLPPATLTGIRWSVVQYENLFSMGLIEPGRYELLDGEIIPKMPIKTTHGFVQTVLLFLLARLFGQDFVMLPVSLQIGEHGLPEPDAVVTQEPRTTYLSQRFLTPEDVRVVIEVSDATLAADLTRKATIYARAKIAEYWVIDVVGRRLLIHGQPTDDGYDAVTQYDETDTATPLGVPSAPFAVRELLPPT
ncbi:MAG: Uma2 family endonuclease [Armatimonadetes bacterium]|nr:Uma2 family endonuclease [Armatimonadota bacterium]